VEEASNTQTEKRRSLGKTFSIVAFVTFISKIVGFLRDIVINWAFGTTLVADAFNYATLLTGNILILFGGLGGPFHSSTVAVISARKNDPAAGRTIIQILTVTVAVLTIISFALWFLAPYLVSAIAPAPGHTQAYREQLWTECVRQTHIMLPMVVIAGIVGVLYGVANIYGQVLWPSLSPALASIAIIIAILFFPQGGGLCLAIGSLVGAVLQLVAQIPAALKSPLKWEFSLKADQELKKYALMLGPAALYTTVGSLTVYIDSRFTSQLQEGAWTAVVNANRLVQLPLGILITAMIVPLLPRFSEQVAEGRIPDLKEELARALRLLWFLCLPISAILLAIPGPIIQVLFERGAFNEQSRLMVTTALVFLVPSIFFYVARDIVTRVFQAYHDTRTPCIVAALALGVKYVLDWWLVGLMGIAGLSLATTLITIFNLFMLTFFMRRKIGRVGIKGLIVPVLIMTLASAAGGGVAYVVYQYLGCLPIASAWIGKALIVGVSSAAALVIYGALCAAMRLDEVQQITKRVLPRLIKTKE